MTYIYDAFGIKRKIEHINAVEHLEKLKQEHGSNFWPVIEECFKIWKSTHPTKWNSYLIYLDDIKQTRRDKFASSKPDAVHQGIFRYTLDLPDPVMKMIRCLYDPEELPMDKDFFRRFAKKFPHLQVAEKI